LHYRKIFRLTFYEAKNRERYAIVCSIVHIETHGDYPDIWY